MRKNEKKMAILNSAFSLFRQNSVSATAIDDIVQACGIARGTFYLYFKDKSDLLEQLVMIKSSECMRNILEPFLNDDEAFVSADFSQTITRCGLFRRTHSRVQTPVGPAPIISTSTS